MSGTRKWLLMTHRVPRQPSRARVYVWRKLKQLGAVLIHDSAWVLPASDRTAEQFRWLAEEIKELGGKASIWTAQATTGEQEAGLVRAFSEDVDRQYAAMLSRLKRGKADLAAVSRQYQEVHARDYFGSAAGRRVRSALLKTRGGDAL